MTIHYYKECPRFSDCLKGRDGTCKGCNLYNAYLAGLGEGKPKWNDIESHVLPKREISKKYMPKANEKVMLKYHFYNETEIHYSDGYYDMFDFEFHIPNNPTGRIICVIAWCELPQFKDKE